MKKNLFAFAMRRKQFYFFFWLPLLGYWTWRWFDSQCAVSHTVMLGLWVFAGAFSWHCFAWQSRLGRTLLALPAEQREQRLAELPPHQRAMISQWLADNEC